MKLFGIGLAALLALAICGQAYAQVGYNVPDAATGTLHSQPVDESNGLPVGEFGRKVAHIATNATTAIKAGKGSLHLIAVGTPGTGETLTCYDSLTGSGTVITVLTPNSPESVIYDVAFTTGLTCVSAGTTAGDFTVAYR